MKAVALLTGIGSVSLCFAIGFAAGKYRPASGGSASRDGARAEPLTALSAGEGAVADVRKAMGARGGTFLNRHRSLLMAIARAENEELPDLYRFLQHGKGLADIREAFIEQWLERDPKGALREALKTDGWFGSGNPEALIAACRREYPKWTWETLLANEAKPSGHALLSLFLNEEVRDDDQRVVAKLLDIENSSARNRNAGHLATGFAGSSKIQIFDLLEHFPLKNFGREIQVRIVDEEARQAPVEMAQFISQMKSGDGRRLAAWVLAGVWAQDDPAATRDWIESTDRFDEFDREELRAKAIVGEMYKDPRAAIENSSDIRSPATRSELINEVLLQWSVDDEASATAWMNENLGGRMLREAHAKLERSLRSSDPLGLGLDPFGLDP